MLTYYRNETLFSEIYLKEITQQPEQADVLASLNVLSEYRLYADPSDLNSWRDSYVHEVLSALGFFAKANNDHLTLLYPIGSDGQKKPLSLCYVVPPDEDLDHTLIGRNWAEKTIRSLRDAGLDWGLLTNGKLWRIYHVDEPTPYETYLEIDLDTILIEKARDAYQVFYKFMKAANFVADEDAQCQFDTFKKESQNKINYIEQELANALIQREEGGKGVLSDLCMGYVEALRAEHVQDFDDDALRKKIYHAAMLYMFRLLFLFYSDARHLLSGENSSTLAQVKQLSHTYLNTGQIGQHPDTLWTHLETIFVDIDQTYNGGLFSPQESEFTQFLSDTRIADQYLASVLVNLTAYREKNGEEKPISYRDMGVRHLGTLYEGLLEHQLFIAQEDTEVRVSKATVIFIPVSRGGKLVVGHYIKAGEVYFASDIQERKASGSYFTPEDVVDFIVQNTLGEKINDILTIFLRDQKPTIKSLESAVDQDELEMLQAYFEETILQFVNEKVLRISVLDPSMGSGHFLVNATNLISNFITKTLNDYELDGKSDSATHFWRRRVVENCIYGVDLNPLAVELAKLSLWILSMAKNKPLSFLNHHLKVGDSLIGERLESIGQYPLSIKHEKPQQLSLFISKPELKSAVDSSIKNSLMIKSQISSARKDVDEKKDRLDQISEVMRIYKSICDIHTSLLYVENPIDENKYVETVEALDTSFATPIKLPEERFHWELEFPAQLFSVSGFDVIIGNPPYANIPEEHHKYFNYRYKTLKSRNLYSLFVEKLIELLGEGGYGSFVLPLSLTFSNNMNELRDLIISKTNTSWKVSSFDRIPDALFGSEVRTRNSILNGIPKEKGKSKLNMTPMYRWFTKDRQNLFSSIEYFEVDKILDFQDEWPKIGSDKQVEILRQLFLKGKNLGMLFSKNQTEFPLYYSTTAYNWLTITNKLPPVYDLSGNELTQTKYGSIYFKCQEDALFCLGVLCSTFSYWYWLIYGDGFDLTKKLLSSIPIHPSNLETTTYYKIVDLAADLQNEMENHIVYKINAGKKIGNYNLRLCRHLTDKIDEIIFLSSGLTNDDISEVMSFCKSMIKTELS